MAALGQGFHALIWLSLSSGHRQPGSARMDRHEVSVSWPPQPPAPHFPLPRLVIVTSDLVEGLGSKAPIPWTRSSSRTPTDGPRTWCQNLQLNTPSPCPLLQLGLQPILPQTPSSHPSPSKWFSSSSHPSATLHSPHSTG